MISATTLSALRKRYFLPNIAVTEQKVQSKGQPQLVMIGVLLMRSCPSTSVRSGNGSVSRSSQRSCRGACTVLPSSPRYEMPVMEPSSRSPASASASSTMIISPASPRAT